VTAGQRWDYAPAPESREIVSIAGEYGLFVNGAFEPAKRGKTFPTINPATEEPLAKNALAKPADVDRAVAAARAAYEQLGADAGGPSGQVPVPDRADLQDSREFAVLESIDNGKPIKETRDVDIPLAAVHSFCYAGWADKLDYAGFGPPPRPLGAGATY
jgi:aldehyde dehydrogenase (NAD+)